MKKDVVVLIGAGSIGLAIARRVSVGKHVVVAETMRSQLPRRFIMQDLLQRRRMSTFLHVNPFSNSSKRLKRVVG